MLSEERIEHFWRWFMANEQQIIASFDNELLRESIIESLDNLILDFGMFTWEIGSGKAKQWFLTISPNGDKDLIKVSKEIIKHAPFLDRWEFNYCKPAKDWDRRFVIYDDNMDEQHIDSTNWNYVALQYEEGKIELILEANNIAHLDHDTAKTAAELFVTSEIGEEAKIQKILSIDIVDQLESKYDSSKAEIQFLKDRLKEL